ncbi:MAG: hypothetical protein U0736_21625 [Gemmataceae bacterium]
MPARDQYKQFCADRGISMGSGNGWQRFIQETSRSRDSRGVSRLPGAATAGGGAPGEAAPAGLGCWKYRRDRVLIFTYDNATVYQIARAVPRASDHSPDEDKEKTECLDNFQTGEYNIVVTSQVLNEGAWTYRRRTSASLSGTSTVREHVQRLGRLLASMATKQALAGRGGHAARSRSSSPSSGAACTYKS